MKPLVLAMFALVALGPAEASDPCRFRVQPPHGPEYVIEKCDVKIEAVMPGRWRVYLEVFYAHEYPEGQRWVATDEMTFQVFSEQPLFWDDFETGTTERWSTVKGDS